MVYRIGVISAGALTRIAIADTAARATGGPVPLHIGAAPQRPVPAAAR